MAQSEQHVIYRLKAGGGQADMEETDGKELL